MCDKWQLKAMVDNRSDDNKSVDHLISNKVSETQQKWVVIKKEPKNWDKIVKQFEAQNKQQNKEEEQSFDNVFWKLYSSFAFSYASDANAKQRISKQWNHSFDGLQKCRQKVCQTYEWNTFWSTLRPTLSQREPLIHISWNIIFKLYFYLLSKL